MMRSLPILLFLILMLLNCKTEDSNFHIYLAFGQSNMEGQGAIEAIDTIVDPRFQMLQTLDCPELGKEKGQWYTAIPPICQCGSGLGPSDYFGRTMVANLPEPIKVGIINVAIGGCDIRLFDKDIYTNYKTTHNQIWFLDKIANYGGNPYKRLIETAKEAQKHGVIKGILLHQGETNTGDTQWPLYVKKIYNNMLEDLSLNAKDVPLLAGEVVNQEGSCCASMNTIIHTLPEVIETAHIISSKDCTAKDYAHFDAKGYRELGKRYARKMLSLLEE